MRLKFDSDSETFRLTSEAYRIKHACPAEPYLAVHASQIEPLPHQISAVYEKLLVRYPLRFVLADDPGAGKTIMTGLLIKELFLRGQLRNVLIVCPAALVEQWQDELSQKFQLRFEILTDENVSTGKFFVAGIDKLVRNKKLQDKLCAADWDLIVCDEAHKMSASVQGKKISRTKRFRLGWRLGKITRRFLLLTATPHNGKDKDFYAFMSLVDPDRFAGAQRINHSVYISDLMRRLVKEDLITFDGKPLFPARKAYTVNYTLSPQEKNLYELVTAYVADGFNRAETLNTSRRNSVGFAMTILQRRLASSPLAIYQSLTRRTKRLQELLDAEEFSQTETIDAEDFDEYEDFPTDESEQREDDLSANMTAASSIDELRQEIQTLQKLSTVAEKVLRDGVDRKWLELKALLEDNENFPRHEKLIIFTEHRDTLNYLREKISALFGDNAVATIHGGLNHGERRNVEDKFRHDENVRVLVATDAAGEGINLQVAHLMINYDLPWNPNRLEQRFGRIHRIGQKNICRLWNLVASDTREGQVYLRLLQKISEEKSALDGKVFDILGKISFDNKPLRELLTEAIRHGDDSDVIQKLTGVVEKSFDKKTLQNLLRERALIDDKINLDTIKNFRQADIGKLNPRFLEKFFVAAFNKFGGRLIRLNRGRYEIIQMPSELPNKIFCDERFSFTNEPASNFLTFGHPLLNDVVNLTLKKFGDNLRRGAIFIDDNDSGKIFRLIFFVKTEIHDGRPCTLSERLRAFEISLDGKNFSTNADLRYRSPTADEREKILSAAKNLGNVEKLAIDFTQKNFVEPELQAVKTKILPVLDKIRKAARDGLQDEIDYNYEQADELYYTNKLDADKFTKDGDELAERLELRLAEIDRERNISASTPEIVTAALIVPAGCLPEKFSADNDARARVEEIAMNAVIKIERELGNTPADVSRENLGYDIESVTPAGHRRFIEVKGRRADADTVTVTRHEILTALDSPKNFILALVAVGENVSVTYLQNPFAMSPDPAAVSVNFRISSLIRQGKIILERIALQR
ncbi:MAG: DUF3883 domain-containing protein [Selenomonadaceae bacterium]|nr:DUF3883 domain-containing protein [Selenomonadaceae bacterium]